MGTATNERCWLCHRALGERIQWHHPVPKSRGGRETVPMHPICHGAIHARFSNIELSRFGADVDAIRSDGEIMRFLAWVERKPPDFHAPTHRKA